MKKCRIPFSCVMTLVLLGICSCSPARKSTSKIPSATLAAQQPSEQTKGSQDKNSKPVDAGSLPVLPASSIELSESRFVKNATPLSICDRGAWVQKLLVEAFSSKNCNDFTKEDLERQCKKAASLRSPDLVGIIQAIA